MGMNAQRFAFDFAPLYRPFAALFGVLPATSYVEVTDDEFTARFGAWRLRTSRANIVDSQLSGPFGVPKTIGPAHLSFRDRGLTMATNNRRGVCLRFLDPVPGIAPTRRIAHPGLTVTVADCSGLVEALESVG
jgi:hypothetical protein